MIKRTIGILGGMGPEATLDCFGKIIKNTPAQRDQDHLRVVIDSNPSVPDRTAAIVGDGQSPVPVIVKLIPIQMGHPFMSNISLRIGPDIMDISIRITSITGIQINSITSIKRSDMLVTPVVPDTGRLLT